MFIKDSKGQQESRQTCWSPGGTERSGYPSLRVCKDGRWIVPSCHLGEHMVCIIQMGRVGSRMATPMLAKHREPADRQTDEKTTVSAPWHPLRRTHSHWSEWLNPKLGTDPVWNVFCHRLYRWCHTGECEGTSSHLHWWGCTDLLTASVTESPPRSETHKHSNWSWLFWSRTNRISSIVVLKPTHPRTDLWGLQDAQL